MKKSKTMLQLYIEEHIPVKELKQAGFFQSKDPDKSNYIKNNRDWEGIAKRVCLWFGLKNIYEYSKLEPFGPGLKTEKEKSVEFVPAKEWIMEGNRLFTLIDNN